MKLKDFLKQFDGMDQELPVCLSDWTEADDLDSEEQAEKVKLKKSIFYIGGNNGLVAEGEYIVIGE